MTNTKEPVRITVIFECSPDELTDESRDTLNETLAKLTRAFKNAAPNSSRVHVAMDRPKDNKRRTQLFLL